MGRFTACSVLAVACLASGTAVAQSSTPRIVSAANAFLATLSDEQRKNVLFAFDDEKQRVKWSNLPVRMVPRSGVSMGELDATQRRAAMALVASALSKRGFEKPLIDLGARLATRAYTKPEAYAEPALAAR